MQNLIQINHAVQESWTDWNDAQQTLVVRISTNWPQLAAMMLSKPSSFKKKDIAPASG